MADILGAFAKKGFADFVNVEALASSLLKKFGGVEGIAEEAKDLYARAKDQPSTQQRILTAILDFAAKAGDQQKDKRPLNSIPTEDLEAELERVGMELAKRAETSR